MIEAICIVTSPARQPISRTFMPGWIPASLRSRSEDAAKNLP